MLTDTRTVTARWISDPGHGWLSVPVADVDAAGVHPTRFSYISRSGRRAYLEEDMDATRFLSRCRELGWTVRLLSEGYSERRSFIRSLPSWPMRVRAGSEGPALCAVANGGGR